MLINTDQFETTKLSDYGDSFQHKLLILLLTKKHLLEQIFDILQPDLFNTNALQWIIDVIKKHFIEYKKPPTLDVFQVYLKESSRSDVQQVAIVNALQTSYKFRNAEDLDFVKEKAVDFFRNKNLEKTLLESVDLLKNGEYEEIKSRIDQAMKAGQDNQLGHDYILDLEARYEENNRETVTTGWNVVDRYLDGGLGIGELGVVIAMSGVGKSWWLAFLAANAIMNDISVVFYTLEMNESEIGKRIDSIITKISTHNMTYHIDTLKKKIQEKVSGNLIIRKYPMNMTTINTISAHLNKLQLLDKYPELMIIDYGDVMLPIRTFSADWLNQKQIFEELKSLAQVAELPLWTASQVGKSGEGEDVIGATSIAQAYAKVAPCDIILSLSRKVDDKLQDTGRLHIAKNRYGMDGHVFPCEIDFSKGIFKVLSQENKKGKQLIEKMKHGSEMKRDKLASKFKKFEEDL